MGIQLNPLGREGQPVISKNGQYIAIGNTNQIDIYDSNINLVAQFQFRAHVPTETMQLQAYQGTPAMCTYETGMDIYQHPAGYTR